MILKNLTSLQQQSPHRIPPSLYSQDLSSDHNLDQTYDHPSLGYPHHQKLSLQVLVWMDVVELFFVTISHTGCQLPSSKDPPAYMYLENNNNHYHGIEHSEFKLHVHIYYICTCFACHEGCYIVNCSSALDYYSLTKRFIFIVYMYFTKWFVKI